MRVTCLRCRAAFARAGGLLLYGDHDCLGMCSACVKALGAEGALVELRVISICLLARERRPRVP